MKISNYRCCRYTKAYRLMRTVYTGQAAKIKLKWGTQPH